MSRPSIEEAARAFRKLWGTATGPSVADDWMRIARQAELIFGMTDAERAVIEAAKECVRLEESQCSLIPRDRVAKAQCRLILAEAVDALRAEREPKPFDPYTPKLIGPGWAVEYCDREGRGYRVAAGCTPDDAARIAAALNAAEARK